MVALTGFSLSFKVDSYDLKVGNIRLSLSHFTLFPQKVNGSNHQVDVFLAGCWPLMRTLL